MRSPIQIFFALGLGLALAAACGGGEGEQSPPGNSSGGSTSNDASAGCAAPNCSACQGCFLQCMCANGNNSTLCLSMCSSGTGGSGTGGSGVGGSGVGGSATGGASGAGVGGSGVGGAGVGGSSAGGAGGTMGTCNASFCPSSGMGTACCQTPNGPCGVDFGMGCMPSAGGG